MCVFSGLFDARKTLFPCRAKNCIVFSSVGCLNGKVGTWCVMLITVNRQLDEFLVIIFALGLFTLISLSARVGWNIISFVTGRSAPCLCRIGELFIIIEIKKVYRKHVRTYSREFRVPLFSHSKQREREREREPLCVGIYVYIRSGILRSKIRTKTICWSMKSAWSD